MIWLQVYIFICQCSFCELFFINVHDGKEFPHITKQIYY